MSSNEDFPKEIQSSIQSFEVHLKYKLVPKVFDLSFMLDIYMRWEVLHILIWASALKSKHYSVYIYNKSKLSVKEMDEIN